VTESTVNKLEQLKLVNPEMNESYIVNRALETFFVSREKSDNIQNLVFESSVKRSILRLDALRNRINMRRSGVDLCVLVEIVTVNLRENPKLSGIDRDIQELAVLIHEIKVYSPLYYTTCLKTTRNLLRKKQLTIFNTELDSCIHQPHVPYIIGGTLDTNGPSEDVQVMAQNCLTAPTHRREEKIQQTLHTIVQKYRDRDDCDTMELCETFTNALHRLAEQATA